MNQVTISNLMMQIKYNDLSVDLVRHLVLNSIRSYRTKFSNDYGELILCYDDKHYWRREYFPNYKSNRKKDRTDSCVNWNELFEKILILSGDKDFIQLQVHNNVQQYSPTLKKYVNGKNPDDYKIEHIFKGDRGDGIPNILSPDNTFTDGLRQRPLGKKKIDDWKQVGTWPIDSWNDELKRNFQRNSKLIDLSLIPDEIKNNIYKCWNEKYDNTRSKILPYFMKHRLRELTERLGDF